MKILILIFYVLMYSSVFCQDNVDKFFNANEYYSDQEYLSSIELYEEILLNVEHEDVYYNLGNAYYRAGDIGNSIWAYERALKLSPRDSDTIFNINYLRTMVRDKIIPPNDMYIISLYKTLMLKFKLSDLIIFVGLLSVFLSIKYIINSYSNVLKSFNSIINYAIFTLIIALSWMALDKYWNVSDKYHGVIVSSAVDVRSSPLNKGENIVFRIHEGTKVEIQNTQSGWSEIVLLDGKKGWVLSKAVREI
tara:strand:+ start:476 stop:1222 length:747 start_codon:yes stop_codon:yes gene_type:complete